MVGQLDFAPLGGTFFALTGGQAFDLTDNSSLNNSASLNPSINPAAASIPEISTVGNWLVEETFFFGHDLLQIACFLRGTRILTSRGKVPVEELQAVTRC